ncbi:methylmalonyl Co-A mutase-associated GTPase MeaB [Limisalsivibrio acetivorans]|uniref:methylmalonyl Co-A mutase-associated GTPase MeaB n=1 Tax=Limisalsivibrio acetivorans TaxID=1304888 RepID=UPI0003B38FC2|nr:methylmalonyl Co-A mutase-associated GTPase MeaB [Limisalsivibrio acetivorans]
MELGVLADKIIEGSRRSLGKGITLIESRKPEHSKDASALLDLLLPHTGNSIRVGITGVPGVGKSTFIEAFGKYLTSIGHRVAVLAVDPSSQITGGSILGDKTRMEELSRDENAFIRPSPAGDTLGGVARRTRETMLLCEAAGYDVIIVETVGVGQSEIAVASMVDFFMLLQLATAGDELQGIKKGVMELADAIVINKADIDWQKAELSKQQYLNALHILRPKSRNWTVPVYPVSSLENRGIEDIWGMLQEFKGVMEESGEFDEKRKSQAVDWMWSLLMDDLKGMFMANKNVQGIFESVQEAVAKGITTPGAASKRLLDAFRKGW